MLFVASEEKLGDAERRIQEFEHNEDTPYYLETWVDKSTATLKGSEEQAHLL